MSDRAGRVVLHVGAPKSGTTYLQSRLHRNAASLAAHGVLVPRADAADGPASLAFRAALDLTGVRLGRGRGYTDGWWDRLVAVVGDHVATGGPAVVSDEAFVRADAAAVARALADLRGTGATLEVVYTARDLARQLVSGWLEGLKHGGTRTFGAYLEAARDGELGAVRAYDVAAVLGRWAEALGDAGRVHLVTVPPEGGDRSLLWTRFLGVAGLDPAWAPVEAARSNDAVGLPEAQFLRVLNERLGAAASRGGRLHAVVQDVVREGLAERGSPRVRLDPRHAGWVEERTSDWLAWARGSGVDVVGDLDDLRPAPVDPATWEDPDRTVPAALDAADAALAAVRAARRR
ncbi:hypothetical protein FE634_00285 [Nocardioides dongxiaopingii]|uniref:hypothetical protein n=1 Tax=Nocardioides sp. S-1144 TaxID=2582905 RepID=UPI00110D9C2E|nr:hypothetical protein [Nocardioides sp. S-1144]QCW49240.1 hypothetical protein FE634_00285 [Nocardioides sp. S-1144]